MKIMSAVLAGAVILSQPAAVYAAADTQDYAEAVIEEDAGSFANEGGEDTGSSADHYEETPGEGTASFSQGDQNIYEGYDSSYVDAAAAQAAEVSGSGDLTETWVMHGRANFILDNIIAEGKAREMIVCFPNDQMVTRSHPKHTELAFPLVERELLECVIPFVESHYSVIRDKHARALSGLSMGGRMTQYVALRNLDVFGSLGILSAAIDLSETPVVNEPDVNDRIDYLFIGGGTYETGFMARHERLHEQLDKLGVKNDYYVGGGGAHDLVTWRHLLYDRFLPNLWRNNYKWK